jgi:hypothetical protein
VSITAVLFVLRGIIALVFGVAAIGKLAAPRRFVSAIRRYELLPPAVAPWMAGVIIISEIFVTGCHMGGLTFVGSAVGAGLLLAFGGAVSVKLLAKTSIPCGCFPGDQETLSGRTLTRIGGLLLADLAVLAASIAMPSERAVSAELDINTIMAAVAITQILGWILLAPEIVTLGRRLYALGHKAP